MNVILYLNQCYIDIIYNDNEYQSNTLSLFSVPQMRGWEEELCYHDEAGSLVLPRVLTKYCSNLTFSVTEIAIKFCCSNPH